MKPMKIGISAPGPDFPHTLQSESVLVPPPSYAYLGVTRNTQTVLQLLVLPQKEVARESPVTDPNHFKVRLFAPISLADYAVVLSNAARTWHWHRWSYCIFVSQMVVKIIFNSFPTESCCDYVSIYDGVNNSSNAIAYLSGNDVSLNDMIFSSTQQYMYIYFTSESFNESQGFVATFESIRKNICIECFIDYVEPTEFCGRNNMAAVFQGHSFVSFLIYNFMTVWAAEPVIVALVIRRDARFHRIRIILSAVGLALRQTADWASLLNATVVLCAKECVSPWKKQQLWTNNRHNYALLWLFAAYAPCPPPTLPQNWYGSGNLTSPYYPENYVDSTDCNWRLKASDGVSDFNDPLPQWKCAACPVCIGEA